MEINVRSAGILTASNTANAPDGSAAPVDTTVVGGKDGGGNVQSLNVDTSGNLAALPLPSGAATSTLQTTGNTSLASMDTKTPALGQAVAGSSTPVVLTAAEEAQLGAVTETAPATDTASSGLNGRLQRIAQRLTSLIALVPASLAQKASASSFAVVLSTEQEAELGALTETAPATDTASSGLNGRLQRIAQRLTTLLAVFPTTIATNTGTSSASVLRVVLATDQPQLTNKLLVTPDANSAINNAQINGVTPLMGNGVTGTGSQRVTIASDNTAFTVNNQVIPQSGSTNAASSLASTALEASHVIKASSGRLLQLTGVNTKASAQYIQVFNSATVPADTTAPVLLAYVPAGGNFSFDFGAIGRYFATGISVSNSSTAATKTIGSADCWFNAEYL